MRNKKLVYRSAFVSAFLLLNVAHSAFATYVYAITNHSDSTLRAYETQNVNLYEQSQISITDEEDGAVGVACADSISRLFVTYESSATIVWANTQTLEQEGYINVYDTGQLAGIVWDESRELLYALRRGQPHMFVCAWDPNDTGSNTLGLMDPNNPSQLYDADDPNCFGPYIELSNVPSTTLGLALDSNTGYVYVTCNSRHVFCYDPCDWSFLGTRDVERAAVGIAIDPCNSEHPGYLYTGGLYTGNFMYGHDYLMRHNLDDPCEDTQNDEYDIDPCDTLDPVIVLGLAVDPETSIIYCTTSDQKIRAYSWTGLGVFCTYEQQTHAMGEYTSAGGGLCVSSSEFMQPFTLTKIVDANSCIGLRDELEYTICYEYVWNDPCDACSPSVGSAYEPCDVTVIDYLPNQVDFVQASNSGSYDSAAHSVSWTISSFTPGQEVCLIVDTVVNNTALPGTTLTNSVYLDYEISGMENSISTSLDTELCALGQGNESSIIYVDRLAQGVDSGSSWIDAFTDLADAIDYSRSCGDEIWVAQGIYRTDPNNPFNPIDNTRIYGGFAGTETDRKQRNWLSNLTILSADVQDNDPNQIDNTAYVVTFVNLSNSTVLDGFELNAATNAAICLNEGSGKIEHCFITDNTAGISCYQTDDPIIRNNWIYQNDANAIAFVNPFGEAAVCNNTIANNGSGIILSSGTAPSITSCILWNNNSAELVDCSATYCCIEGYDPCDPCTYGIGNFNADPCFIDPTADDPNYHIDPCSPCRDAGDIAMDLYTFQMDIDRHNRVMGDYVDIGADEIEDCTHNPADFNTDYIVDMLDFETFSYAWHSDPCDTNWNSACDLVESDEIDIVDFAYFSAQWLWLGCGSISELEGSMCMMMSTGMESLNTTQSAELIAEPAVVEITIEQQIENLVDIIQWTEEVPNNTENFYDDISPEQWKEFQDALEKMLEELLTQQ